jgi:SPW repeat
MARIDQFKVHKSWEDWIILGLGAALIVSPAFDSVTRTPLVLLNAIMVGFLILCLAISELSLIEQWDEWVSLVLGIWMIVAPSALGYVGTGILWFWHMAIGAIVALLALLELWQDWSLSDEELSKRGQ